MRGWTLFGVPQPRRSASRNRAVESAPGEEDSSVSFNGAELTAELSPMLRPRASLIGRRILRSLPRCTAKIPANQHCQFSGQADPKSRPTWETKHKELFFPPLAEIPAKFARQRRSSVPSKNVHDILLETLRLSFSFSLNSQNSPRVSQTPQNLISRFV